MTGCTFNTLNILGKYSLSPLKDIFIRLPWNWSYFSTSLHSNASCTKNTAPAVCLFSFKK
jgi:hypothetical protein